MNMQCLPGLDRCGLREKASTRRRKQHQELLLTQHLPNNGTESGIGVEAITGKQGSRRERLVSRAQREKTWQGCAFSGEEILIGAEAYKMPPYLWNLPLQQPFLSPVDIIVTQLQGASLTCPHSCVC